MGYQSAIVGHSQQLHDQHSSMQLGPHVLCLVWHHAVLWSGLP